MEQQPEGIVSDVVHDVGFEVSKTVALETGDGRISGEASVVLVLHPLNYTFRFAWTPDVARGLGELLIEQADLIDPSATSESR